MHIVKRALCSSCGLQSSKTASTSALLLQSIHRWGAVLARLHATRGGRRLLGPAGIRGATTLPARPRGWAASIRLMIGAGSSRLAATCIRCTPGTSILREECGACARFWLVPFQHHKGTSSWHLSGRQPLPRRPRPHAATSSTHLGSHMRRWPLAHAGCRARVQVGLYQPALLLAHAVLHSLLARLPMHQLLWGAGMIHPTGLDLWGKSGAGCAVQEPTAIASRLPTDLNTSQMSPRDTLTPQVRSYREGVLVRGGALRMAHCPHIQLLLSRKHVLWSAALPRRLLRPAGREGAGQVKEQGQGWRMTACAGQCKQA